MMTTDPVQSPDVFGSGNGPLDPAEDRRIRLTERESQFNLHVVLGLCEAERLTCSEKTRRPSASALRQLTSRLADDDYYYDEPIAAMAWPLLIQAGGLADLSSGRLRLTAKGRAATQKPSADVIRQLWRGWLNHAVIDEFSRIDHIKGQRAANVLTAAKNRREVVSEALAQCPVGEWVGIEALFRMMRNRRLSPTIARSERALWKLYLVDAQYGSLGYEGFGDWEILEGRYTLAVLFEYAATLGLIDIDYVHPAGARDDYHQNWGADDLEALSRYDGLQAIRLTELGAYTLGLSPVYAPADGSPVLSIGPDFTIRASGPLQPDDERTLSDWCETVAPGRWLLSDASLLLALDAGHDIDALVASLRNRIPGDLPGEVQTLLHETRERASRLTDRGMARVIACADAELADLLMQDPRISRWCRRLGTRELVIPVQDEAEVRSALLELGHVLPAPDARR